MKKLICLFVCLFVCLEVCFANAPRPFGQTYRIRHMAQPPRQRMIDIGSRCLCGIASKVALKKTMNEFLGNFFGVEFDISFNNIGFKAKKDPTVWESTKKFAQKHGIFKQIPLTANY